MDKIIDSVSVVRGKFKIPASKSYGQRALACSLINHRTTTIYNLGISDDEQGLLQLIAQAGAEVTTDDDKIRIKGVSWNNKNKLRLNCRESGLASRMITPVLANADFPIELNGHGSLLNRPMAQFDDVMKKLKVDFQSNEGKLPFHIRGSLIPASIQIDGTLSSQFVTGLILGFVGSKLLNNQVIEVINPTSIPYIELTLEVLKEFGVDLTFQDNKISFSGPYDLKDAIIHVEGDWSSASFFLVAGAILGEITIEGLNLNSKQADRKILEALIDFGAEINLDNGVKIIKKDSKAFNFDATHCPDLFPPLAVLASFGSGVSRIRGVSRLMHKESNRAESIQTELTKMGAKIAFEGDDMLIEGNIKVNSASINTHGDHRIAMASAIMALKADGKTTICNAEVVGKSFPEFYQYLEKII
jgi:3-phosphoshikimate 1-carboxyvinyltransferase